MLENILASSIVLGGLLLIVIVVYYFYSFSLVKKRKAYLIKLHESIAVGKRVVFAGGIYGKIVDLQDDMVTVEVKKGAHLLISRYSISEVIEEGK